MVFDRLTELGQHDRCGHPVVGSQVNDQAGAVVDPGQDLNIGAAGEWVVGGGTSLHGVLGGKSDCQVSLGMLASKRM